MKIIELFTSNSRNITRRNKWTTFPKGFEVSRNTNFRI